MTVRTREVPDIEADGKWLNTSRDPPGQKSVYLLPGVKQNVFMLLNSDCCLFKNPYFFNISKVVFMSYYCYCCRALG